MKWIEMKGGKNYFNSKEQKQHIQIGCCIWAYSTTITSTTTTTIPSFSTSTKKKIQRNIIDGWDADGWVGGRTGLLFI